MLTIKNLHVPPVVHDFNLVAERGTVTCIAGQVGSGAIDDPARACWLERRRDR